MPLRMCPHKAVVWPAALVLVRACSPARSCWPGWVPACPPWGDGTLLGGLWAATAWDGLQVGADGESSKCGWKKCSDIGYRLKTRTVVGMFLDWVVSVFLKIASLAERSFTRFKKYLSERGVEKHSVCLKPHYITFFFLKKMLLSRLM